MLINQGNQGAKHYAPLTPPYLTWYLPNFIFIIKLNKSGNPSLTFQTKGGVGGA